MKKFDVSVFHGTRKDMVIEAPDEMTAKKIAEIITNYTNVLDSIDEADAETDITVDPIEDEDEADDDTPHYAECVGECVHCQAKSCDSRIGYCDGDMEDLLDDIGETFIDLKDEAKHLEDVLDETVACYEVVNDRKMSKISKLIDFAEGAFSDLFDLLEQIDTLEKSLNELTDMVRE